MVLLINVSCSGTDERVGRLDHGALEAARTGLEVQAAEILPVLYRGHRFAQEATAAHTFCRFRSMKPINRSMPISLRGSLCNRRAARKLQKSCAASYAADGNCYVPGASGVFLDLITARSADPSEGRGIGQRRKYLISPLLTALTSSRCQIQTYSRPARAGSGRAR